MLYAGIAHDGVARSLRRFADEAEGTPHRLFGTAAAFHLWDVLKDAPLPDGWAMGQGLARARAIAFKTGTSYGFRDAWTVGFSNRFTVGVWTGRADGSPRAGIMGRNEAAPLMMKMFDALPSEPERERARPPEALFALNAAQLPPALQRFSPRAVNPGLARETPPPSIAFPPDGATLELAADEPPLLLKSSGGVAPLRWLIDGVPLAIAERDQTEWQPAAEGFVRVTVIDAQGRAATSKVRLKRAM
jgi:penicillin-binding protein 1C